MSAKIKAAVVGAGWWGRVHIEAYWRNPDTELVAICTRSNSERTLNYAKMYGAKAYFDIKEMIKKEKPDIVSAVLPDDKHYESYKTIINAGVNCLLEKPLAMDLNKGRMLVKLARKKKIFCAINFNHRYASPFLMLSKFMKEGKIGNPHHLLWRFTGGHYPEGYAGRAAHLLYMQCHGFNIMTTFGGKIKEISGFAQDARGTKQLTSVVLSVKFESGAVGNFTASVDGDYKDPGIYSFEIMGDKGRAVITDAIKKFEYFPRVSPKNPEPVNMSWEPGFFDDDGRSFSKTTDRHIADIVLALKEGKREPISVEEGLEALENGVKAIKAVAF